MTAKERLLELTKTQEPSANAWARDYANAARGVALLALEAAEEAVTTLYTHIAGGAILDGDTIYAAEARIRALREELSRG